MTESQGRVPSRKSREAKRSRDFRVGAGVIGSAHGRPVPETQGAIVMEPFLVPGGEVGRDISVFRDLLGNGDLDEEEALSAQFIRRESR